MPVQSGTFKGKFALLKSLKKSYKLSFRLLSEFLTRKYAKLLNNSLYDISRHKKRAVLALFLGETLGKHLKSAIKC